MLPIRAVAIRSLTPVECAPAHIGCMWPTGAHLQGHRSARIHSLKQLEGRSINLERLWPCPRRSLFEAVSKTCTLCAPSVASRSAVSLRSIHQVSSRVSNVAELMEHLRVVA